MAGVADHIALTGRTRLKRRIPFLMRIGASVGGTWMTKDVVSLVILSKGRRVERQVHNINYGLLEEGGVGGEGGGGDTVDQK